MTKNEKDAVKARFEKRAVELLHWALNKACNESGAARVHDLASIIWHYEESRRVALQYLGKYPKAPPGYHYPAHFVTNEQQKIFIRFVEELLGARWEEDLLAEVRSEFDRGWKRALSVWYPKNRRPHWLPEYKVNFDDDDRPRWSVGSTRLFISYSHDSLSHKEWVAKLAADLSSIGLKVVYDQSDLIPGEDISKFMERNLERADYVVVVCTSTYVEKSRLGKGGAGYEKMIMTSSMLRNQSQRKFIPIVVNNQDSEVPEFLSTRLFVDFNNRRLYKRRLVELGRAFQLHTEADA